MELLGQMSLNDWILLTIIVSIWTCASTVVIVNNFNKWWSYIGPAVLVILVIFIMVSGAFLKGLVLLLVD